MLNMADKRSDYSKDVQKPESDVHHEYIARKDIEKMNFIIAWPSDALTKEADTNALRSRSHPIRGAGRRAFLVFCFMEAYPKRTMTAGVRMM